MKKAYTIWAFLIFTPLVFALPKTVSAAVSSGADWNLKTFSAPSTAVGDENSCEATLFTNDRNNLYAENICSLSRVISSTTVDFATKITCQVQATPDEANYAKSVAFTYNGSQCKPSGGFGNSTDNIFGEKGKTGGAGGFYDLANNKSQLTDSIITSSGKSSVQSIFEVARNITTILAFLVLIVVAFANILHFDINTYAVKKALPTLVIALVGGWLSIYVIFILSRGIDFLYSISWFSPYQALHPMQNIFNGTLGGNPTDPFASLDLVFGVAKKLFGLDPSFISGILGTVFLLIPAIAVFVFEYLMALRPLVVEILTAIAPIAFLTLLLPQTQGLFKKWWTILLTALFFAPVVNFVFFILNQMSPSTTSPVIILTLMLFKTAVVVFLIRLPFTFESDFRNLSMKISGSGLGEIFGLKKGRVRTDGQLGAQAQTISDKIMQNPQAQKVIAGIEGRQTLASDRELRRIENIKTRPYLDRSALPDIAGIFNNAGNSNMSRTGAILARSVADLAPETFKKAVRQSDLRLWQDPRAISDLKNQNGQILDDQGAAIRADAARKLVRLAQVVEKDTFQNPEAIKALATKGVLDNLPFAVVQKAIKDSVLTKNDLLPTYGNETARAFEQLQNLDFKKSDIISLAQAKTLMNQDQKDYSTGFKDMVGLFSNVVKDTKILPPPPPSTIKDIVTQMRSHGSDVFENNGMYYLERLGKIRRDSENLIVSSLQKSGAPVQTAVAIAKNPRLDLSQVKDYVKTEALTPESLSLLREGFINRDLSNQLTSQIAIQVSSQKKVFSEAVCNRLSENLKTNQSLSFDEIKKTLKSYLTQEAITPESAKAFAEEVDKYYPGTAMQTSSTAPKEAIDESKKHAQSVLDTIEGLSKAGFNEKTLSANLNGAKVALQSQVAQGIQKAVAGTVATDTGFNTKLGEISANKPSQTGPVAGGAKVN